MPRQRQRGVLEEFLINGEPRDPLTIKNFKITIRYPNGERASMSFQASTIIFDETDRKFAKKLGIS